MGDIDPWENNEWNEANEHYNDAYEEFERAQENYNKCQPGCSPDIMKEYKEAQAKVTEARQAKMVETAKSFGINRTNGSFLDGFDDSKMIQDWSTIKWGDGSPDAQADGADFTKKYEQYIDRLENKLNISQETIRDIIKKNGLKYEPNDAKDPSKGGKISGDTAGADKDLEEEAKKNKSLDEDTAKKWSWTKLIMTLVLSALGIAVSGFALYWLIHGLLCDAAEANSGCMWVDPDSGKKYRVAVAGGPSYCDDMQTCCGKCADPFMHVGVASKCGNGNCCACSFDANWKQHGCSSEAGTSTGTYSFYCKSPWDIINDILDDLANAVNPGNWEKWIKIILYCALGLLGVVAIFYLIKMLLSKKAGGGEHDHIYLEVSPHKHTTISSSKHGGFRS